MKIIKAILNFNGLPLLVAETILLNLYTTTNIGYNNIIISAQLYSELLVFFLYRDHSTSPRSKIKLAKCDPLRLYCVLPFTKYFVRLFITHNLTEKKQNLLKLNKYVNI